MPLPVPPPLNPELRYHNYGAWIRRRTGRAAIRIGIDGGFSCPNRDAGGEGCFYCNNEGFTPGIRHAGQVILIACGSSLARWPGRFCRAAW